ncbi:MAG: hypothetical protein OHK0028_03470 [Deltaproteobacteria bacterium]
MTAAKTILLIGAALLAGCAGAVPVRVEPPAERGAEPAATAAEVPDAFREIPGKYRERADSAERAGDLRRALLYRKVVRGFLPEDADAREHVERLERKIHAQADRRFRAAIESEARGETAKALREYLAVLLLDPGHEEAFRRVKHGMYGENGKNGRNGGGAPEYRTWKVREGDTFAGIAAEVYRDPGMEFLVSWLHPVPKGTALSVGTELILPVIDTETPGNPEKGSGYSRPKKEGNDPVNSAERKESAGRKLREAEEHYTAGLRRFLAEDLEGAIREWEKTLAIDPGHPKARRDIGKARRLMRKIETPQ